MKRRIETKKSLAAALGLAACVVAATAFAADDLTVESGQTQTVESDVAYGRLVINGSLTVASGVTLTCEQLCVGTGAVENASLVLQSCATVSVTKASAKYGHDCVVGINGGKATLTLADGASLDVTGAMGLAFDEGAFSYGTIVLNGASRLKTTGGLYVNRGSWSGCDAATPYATVELNGSSRLETAGAITKNSGTTVTFRFNGGELCGTGSGALVNDNQTGKLVFESVDGQDIKLRRTADFSSLVAHGENGASFETTGSGALVKLGAGTGALAGLQKESKAFKSFALNAAGGIRVEEGALRLDATSAAKLSNVTARVAVGGTLDLFGNDAALNGLETAGVVTNSSATAATLTVGANGGDAVFVAPPAADLPVVKTGAGTLKVPDGTLANLTVEGGTVEFLNRRDVGFPYYRLFVEEKTTFRLSEVAFLNGEDDVTGAWTAISRIEKGGQYYGAPTGLVDRVDATIWDDRSYNTTDDRTNRTFFVTHFGGAPSYPFGWYMHNSGKEQEAEVWTNAAAPSVSAAFSQPLTGYRLKTCKDRALPKDWRVSGGFADGITANVWQDLSVVRGASVTSYLTWSETYALSYTNAAVSVGSLTLADGARWELDVAQGRMTLESLALGGGGTLVLRNFSKSADLKTLPVAVGLCETAANLEKWTVVCEGRSDWQRRLVLRDGALGTESTLGAVLIVR